MFNIRDGLKKTSEQTNLHIAIDAHSVGTGLAGNESYITNLIEALAEIDTENTYTLYVTRKAAVERFHQRWPNFSVRLTLPHSPLIRIPLTLSIELRRRPVDVLHVQFTAPPLAPCPVVASIHDLSFEHLPDTFNRRSRAQLKLTVRKTARTAAELITISDFSKNDIAQTYRIDPSRITVTPLAAASRFSPVGDSSLRAKVRDKYSIEGDYILAVGSIQPRKNLVRLIAAYSDLCNKRGCSGLPKLVIAGKNAWLYEETMDAVRKSRLESQILLIGYVQENDLPALYSDALCFIYPSYFEGFGLPPLEAMQCGTPVIAGNRTSLPEVVGDAGLLVDPFNVDAIGRAIAMLVGDHDLRTQLRTAGIQRASSFTWNRTAAATLEVYRRATRSGNEISGHSADFSALND